LFSPGTPVSFTNKTNRHDITELLLKVVLNTINQTKPNHYVILLVSADMGIVKQVTWKKYA
jgi:predicted component of type VI protein secretion system